MRKLMMILASLTITATTATTVVACNNGTKENKINVKDKYQVVPTVKNIRAAIQKDGVNPDDVDIDIQPGMKSAIIRYMPNTPNLPFLTKKIALDWATTDINKMLKILSVPYSENDLGKYVKPETALAIINILNGTQFTLGQVNVNVDNDSHIITLTPKSGSGLTGNAVTIDGQPITFNDIFQETNLGTIYIDKDLYDKYISNPNYNILFMAAAIMEFGGDRNRFPAYYKSTMATAMINAIGSVVVNIDPNTKKGTFSMETKVDGVIAQSGFTFNFTVDTNPRTYLTQNNTKPTLGEVIDVNLPGTYTEQNLDQLRYDLVKQLLGENFANKYKDIFYDEIWVLSFDANTKKAVLTPKPGSKIFEISDQDASPLTGIPDYTLNVTFGG
ncbi:hypothetical protein P344_01835 [Spiroplasma mirum ATCC 29335]|uniref:Lipoprotein n=1 Tax=Spiroplasma mirum ATCC 29335 TaxID=838561 RepID=W0GKH6_9MOLU|nr:MULTISPECIES: hypothetical protein [Spiroplasma]AHF60755.1 putative lipoprotein [Spiroplasma mirum ATCC 29335]AHI57715.1 hypothetical protein P344_01835 [Spiroplasma mirum ATCC 29335]AKM52874.1 hypothetical protein SATRI_v1c03470 [Spiroplasma atrichopogonis]